MLPIQTKIEMALSITGITKTELARRLDMSKQNFSERLKVGKFSDNDFKAIASALGAEYYFGFTFPDGTRIE